MARFDLEKLAEELAAEVRTDFEREIEKARADGYRAGIEAAAKVIERQEWVEPNIQAAYARVVRALSAPAAPKAPERGAAYPICNVESEFGHHCQLPTGHPTKHMDKHGNWWSEPNREPGRCPHPPHACVAIGKNGSGGLRCEDCGAEELKGDEPWPAWKPATVADKWDDGDGQAMKCRCGRVTLDFFTGTHSMLTKEGEQFISTNHRRDRCDREEVIPDPPAAPAWTMQGCPECRGTGKESTGNPSGEGGEEFRECFRCQGTGFVPFPGAPPPTSEARCERCERCGGTGNNPNPFKGTYGLGECPSCAGRGVGGGGE